MGVANKLQDIITCVGLESFYDDYLNVVLKLQDEVRVNLEKLLAFQVSVKNRFVNILNFLLNVMNYFCRKRGLCVRS